MEKETFLPCCLGFMVKKHLEGGENFRGSVLVHKVFNYFWLMWTKPNCLLNLSYLNGLGLCFQVSGLSKGCFPWALSHQINVFLSTTSVPWMGLLLCFVCVCVFSQKASLFVLITRFHYLAYNTFWNCYAGVHSSNRKVPIWPSATLPLLGDWREWLQWQLSARLAEFQKVIKRMELDAWGWLMQEEVARWTGSTHSSGHTFRPPAVFS